MNMMKWEAPSKRKFYLYFICYPSLNEARFNYIENVEEFWNNFMIIFKWYMLTLLAGS